MNAIAASLIALILLAIPALAQDQTQNQSADLPDPPLITEADALEPFLWIARPVVVFADSPNDPRFIQQMELLEARKHELFERDVVVLVDTDPSANSELRRTLRPRGFMLAVIAKDGTIAQRKPSPWDVREITRAIDKMPLRKQEIRDRRGTGAG